MTDTQEQLKRIRQVVADINWTLAEIPLAKDWKHTQVDRWHLKWALESANDCLRYLESLNVIRGKE